MYGFRRLTALCILVILAAAVGCGGGSNGTISGGSGQVPNTTLANLRVDVGFDAAREILARFPGSTSQLVVEVYAAATGNLELRLLPVARTGQLVQTLEIAGLSGGNKLIRVLALDATGAIIAFQDSNATLINGQTVTVIAFDPTPGAPPNPSPSPSPGTSPSPGAPPSPSVSPSPNPSPSPASSPSPTTPPSPTASPSPSALPVASLNISPASGAQVRQFDTFQFTLTAILTDGSTQVVTELATWTSEENSVAAPLTPGLFKGLNPGTAQVKAVLSGQQALANLQVVPIPGIAGPESPPLPPAYRNFPLYIVSPGDTQLQKFDSSGTVISPDPFANGIANNDVRQPAFDLQGNLILPSFTGNSLQRVDRTTGAVTTFSTDPRLNGPEAVLIGPDGRVYVTCINSNQLIRLEADGTGGVLFAATGAGPVGLALDSARNIYVANFRGKSVSAFRPDGSPLASFGGTGTVSLGVAPLGLAFSPDGNRLYVSDQSVNKIFGVSLAGAVTDFITGLSQPRGLTVDQAGNVYVVQDNGVGRRVSKFDATGAAVNLDFIPNVGTGGLSLSP